MRPLEVALMLCLLPGVLALFLPLSRRPRWTALVGLAALTLVPVQLLAEGFRWQMVPAYGLALLLGLLGIQAWRRDVALTAARPGKIWQTLGALAVLLVFAVGAALSIGLPMFELPKPTGPLAIGTTSLGMLDSSRPEGFSPAADDRRELEVRAWYPATAAGNRPEALWGSDARLRAAVAHAMLLPGFVFDHLAAVSTHSYANAEPLAGPHPVILFSHGYAQGFTAQNTALMEELASHGYAVFSIGHPHEASAVRFPDGRMVEVNKPHVMRMLEVAKAQKDKFESVRSEAPPAERVRRVRELVAALGPLNDSLRLWSADTRFVLDELVKLNAADSGSPLAGKLDLSRVGVLGMSFGGATAGQVCLDDPRVKAGVNLDGTVYGDMVDRPLSTPFLFMQNPEGQAINRTLFERAQGPGWFMVVQGSRHFDFTDFPLVTPIFRLLGFIGSVPGERMVHITNAYTLAFFDQQLRGQASPLLEGPSPDYPEVLLDRRGN